MFSPYWIVTWPTTSSKDVCPMATIPTKGAETEVPIILCWELVAIKAEEDASDEVT